ncbi:MAG: hypothetical protein CML98_04110 [Rhodobiaceae bacterium]|nr:hypothetical protein [Rhodobiaceae bacterium]|tara:strand:- start:1601 stop:1987 length:387 start_codon:yes stop_codon:yes gene_type:complete
MEFKVNLALFKSTEEGNKKFYGDKYDPSKPYPQYTGNIQFTEMDIIKMVEYLQKATPERTDFHPEGSVTVKASAYVNTSKSGLQYLSINLEPDYKTLMAIKETDSGMTSTSSESSTPPVQTGEDFIPF